MNRKAFVLVVLSSWISGSIADSFIESLLSVETLSYVVKEKTLLRIALAASAVGIVVLFLLSQQISVDEAMVSRLDEMVDESVVVTGSVIGVNSLDSVTFVMLQKDEIVTVVLFGKTPLVEVGDLVQVRGEVVEEDGEVEIIGEEMRIV